MKSEYPYAPDLPADAPPKTRPWFVDLNDSGQLGKGRQPPRKAKSVQRLVMVADQYASRLLHLLCNTYHCGFLYQL